MRPTKNKILDSLIPVVSNPRYVRINKDRIREVATNLVQAKLPLWDNNAQFIGTPAETAQYYFFLDSTNFCFCLIELF